jgi:hypothetical protein
VLSVTGGHDAPTGVFEDQTSSGSRNGASIEVTDAPLSISAWQPLPDTDPPQAHSGSQQLLVQSPLTFPASAGQVIGSTGGGTSPNAAFASALPALGSSAFVVDIPLVESTPSSPTYIPFTPPRVLQA